MNRTFYFSIMLMLASLSSCKKSPGDSNTTQSPYKLNYMEIEEHDKYGILTLHGYFPDSSAGSQVKIGSLTIGSVATDRGQILSWYNAYIRVKVMTGTEIAGGYVSVAGGGTETNKRLLNVWEGTMYYREPDEGTLMKEIEFRVLLRADSKPYTNVPAIFNPRSSFTDGAWANIKMGGTGSSHSSTTDRTVTLDAQRYLIAGNEPYVGRTGADSNFQVHLTFKDRKFNISALKVHKYKATKKRTLTTPSTQEIVVDFFYQVEVLPLNTTFSMEFEGNTDVIKAGTWSSAPHTTQYGLYWDASEAVNHKYVNTLEWSRMEPKYK